MPYRVPKLSNVEIIYCILSYTLQNNTLTHRGTLEIRAEAQTNTRDLFVVSFRGYKLANKDGFFGTSDPFLSIAR